MMRGLPYFMRLCFCVVCALLPALAFGGAAAQSLGAAPAFGGRPLRLPADKAPLLFARGGSPRAFQAEIARTAEENRRGLMYRRIFPQDRAMLFVLGAPRVQTMWMANTPLPLDMVFADKAGKIVSVFEGAEPYSRRLISSRYPAAYAVELNAGTVKREGIAAGQFIRHPVICGACKD